MILLKDSCPAYPHQITNYHSYCVPDLELDVFVVDLDCPRTELDAYSQIVLLSEPFVSKLEKQTRFPDAYIREFKDLPTEMREPRSQTLA